MHRSYIRPVGRSQGRRRHVRGRFPHRLFGPRFVRGRLAQRETKVYWRQRSLEKGAST
jgi:hypothetical protein